MIDVLVVSGVRLYRDGIADVLRRQSDIHLAGTTATAEEAVATLEHTSPDVLLLDMPIAEGRAAIRAIGRTCETVRLLALGVTESEDEVIAWAEAGAAGYVSREASSDELTASIEAVVRGEALCSPKIAAALLRRLAMRPEAPGFGSSEQVARLTARERLILELIDQGHSNKEIARQLCIELSTVKNHVHNILEKLHLHSRSQAAALLHAAPRVN